MKSARTTLSEAVATITPPAADDMFAAEGTDRLADSGRRGILVRVTAKLRRELKLAAIARDTTVQDLMVEAIAIVLQSSGQPPKP